MSIDKSKFWGTNHYNHPPLTEEMIAIAEKSLDVKLPALFIELLRIQNGGYTAGFAFPMTQKTTWADDHVPLSKLCGIVTDESIKTAHNIMDSHYMTEEWELPPKQVLLAGEGEWWITLDYRDSSIPTVRWLDVECDEDVLIANSFEEFFNGLVPESNYDD